MKTASRFLPLLLILILHSPLQAQELPAPVRNTGIYDFLDELAALQIISVNSAVKPWSRLFIARCLDSTALHTDRLNERQRKELEFYLRDYGKELHTGKDWDRRKDLYYFSNDDFQLTVNPILGAELFSNSSGRATYWRNGAEARAYTGKWGFYAALRDNHEDPLLGKAEYLTHRDGGHIKGTSDWSEMTGGVTFAWKWGSAGLVKDRLQWGTNYNGANIFGGNNPSFVQFKLHINPVKWFSFDYFHGWLNSMVVDSAESYLVSNSYGTDYREVYHKKYIAANMLTITPLKYLNISAGNSIVYSDSNVNPAYLIPVFFYKSVDHGLTSGIDNMNSQMFLGISSRQIKNLHLHATLFIDELSVSRFTKDDEWNFLSWKAGFRLSDLPLTNLFITGEYTYTYPLTFQHYVPTLTFETARFNLGHYLKDNSREWYFAAGYKPVRALDITLYFCDAVRGKDYTALGTDRLGNPPLESVEWHSKTLGIRSSYQPLNDLYIWMSYESGVITGNTAWTPAYYFGNRKTINGGVTVGF